MKSYMGRIVNYNCRYVHDSRKPVYTVMRLQEHLHKSEFFTTAFHNHHTRDSSNALVAFACPEQAKHVAKNSGDDTVAVQELSIRELVDFSFMVKLPVVVVLSMYCSLDEPQADTFYEIYYQDTRNKPILDLNDKEEDYRE